MGAITVCDPLQSQWLDISSPIQGQMEAVESILKYGRYEYIKKIFYSCY